MIIYFFKVKGKVIKRNEKEQKFYEVIIYTSFGKLIIHISTNMIVKKGTLSEDLLFPILSIIGNQRMVFRTLSSYTKAPKKYISKLNKLKEHVVDHNGNLYLRNEVSPISLINNFGGFSLKFAGFGICHVHKNVVFQKELDINEIKEIISKILKSKSSYLIGADINPKVIKEEIKECTDRDRLINLLFYSSDPGSVEKIG